MSHLFPVQPQQLARSQCAGDDAIQDRVVVAIANGENASHGAGITEEICKELGITPTNLWVILHRARLSLRECIEIKWGAAGA